MTGGYCYDEVGLDVTYDCKGSVFIEQDYTDDICSETVPWGANEYESCVSTSGSNGDYSTRYIVTECYNSQDSKANQFGYMLGIGMMALVTLCRL